MTGTPGLIVLLAAIVITVVVAEKFNINVGMVAFFAALAVGWIAGIKPQNVLALFPTSLFVILILTTGFFGFVQMSGIFEGICNRIVYAFRKKGWAIPIALMLACYVVAVLGAGNYGTPALVSPLAFGLAATCGFSTTIAVAIVWIGSTLSGMYPWMSKYLTLQTLYTESFGEVGASQAMIVGIVVQHLLFFLMFFVAYFYTKSYRCKARPDMEKPAPFTGEQKKALTLLATFFVLLCVPGIIKTFLPKNALIKWMTTYLDIRSLCALFMLVFHVAKIGDMKTVIQKKIPFAAILKTCGMVTLVSLANELGVVDTTSNYLSGGSLPAFLVTPILILICAALGSVTDGLNVVAVLFIPITAVLAPIIGVSGPMLASCVFAAANCTSVSPLSVGGNMASIGASEEQREAGLYKNQFIYCGFQVLLFLIAGIIGLWSIFGKLFGF